MQPPAAAPLRGAVEEAGVGQVDGDVDGRDGDVAEGGVVGVQKDEHVFGDGEAGGRKEGGVEGELQLVSLGSCGEEGAGALPVDEDEIAVGAAEEGVDGAGNAGVAVGDKVLGRHKGRAAEHGAEGSKRLRLQREVVGGAKEHGVD